MIRPGPDLRAPPVFGELQFVFLILVLAALEDGSGRFNWRITSWYRDPQRNAEVGGVANSLHVAGLAMDIVPEQAPSFLSRIFSPSDATGLISRWRSFGPIFQGIQEGDHIHLELDVTP